MMNPAGRMHKTPELYAYYLTTTTTPVTYTLYLKVLKSYFTGIVALLLKGWSWHLGKHLASISIQKVRRRYTKPRPNWGATKKLLQARPELPSNTVVYFTDQPFWYRYYWNKTLCVIPNRVVYRFDPTCGPYGNGRKISRLLESDPFAHLNFALNTATSWSTKPSPAKPS